MIKISIVVPVFNAENMVPVALKMLLDKQDMNASEYEVICVNDGSTDNSLEVLKNYQKRYANVHLINQSNKGLGGARNTGILNAKGEYILFVDADDYICPNTLSFLYRRASVVALDILEFGAQGIRSDGTIAYTSTVKKESAILTGEGYIASIRYMNSACNKLYSRQLLSKNHLLFLERVYIEDVEFNTRTILLAKRVQAISTIIGQFVQTEGSITRSTDYSKQLKMMEDMFRVIVIINNYIKNEVTQSSCAYLNLNKRVSFLVTSLLYRSLREGRDLGIQKIFLSKLYEKELYPIKYSTNNLPKNFFRLFANQKHIYIFLCWFINIRANKNLG